MVGLLCLFAGTAATAAEDDYAAARQAFLLAYTAAAAGLPLPPEAETAELRTYPLYPYLERARVLRALETAEGGYGPADEQAAALLAAHAGQPLAPELARGWLRSLARRKLWRDFLEQFDPSVADVALRCEWLNARIAVEDTEGLEAAVIERWLTGERLPPACEAPFEWLRARGAMTSELIARRATLLLDNGQAAFARTVLRRLPRDQAAPLLERAELIEKPLQAIDALIANPGRPVDSGAMLDGWRRLARNDPMAALAHYERLVASRKLDERDRSRYALAAALGLAWDRRAAEALELFAKVAAEDFDDNARAWQARAALWRGDWRQVDAAIAAMSAEQRAQARWRYWSARSAARHGDERRARALYSEIIPTDNFYAASAAARLGMGARPHPQALELDETLVTALGGRPEFVRARELQLCRMQSEALGEWLAGFRALEGPARRQAVHLASSWGWHDVAVAMASREQVFFDYALLYPQPFDDAVAAAAGAVSLPETLLYALVRQESLFRPDAVSSAGAMGLAQLLPSTAQITARQWSMPIPRPVDLLDPAVNLRLGAAHLRSLTDRFDGQTPVAIAAYNAGARAAERWLPAEPLDADVWIENIPYNETRDYVQRVLWHSVVFGWLRTGTPQNVDAWLTPIQPRAANAAN